MRLIDADAAIEAFGLSEKTRKYGGDHSGYNTMMLYEIQGVLDDLPTVQPQTGKWIPVFERLPEEFGDYLVTWKSGTVSIISYYDADNIRCNTFNKYVKAWMPLPKAYKVTK